MIIRVQLGNGCRERNYSKGRSASRGDSGGLYALKTLTALRGCLLAPSTAQESKPLSGS